MRRDLGGVKEVLLFAAVGLWPDRSHGLAGLDDERHPKALIPAYVQLIGARHSDLSTLEKFDLASLQGLGPHHKKPFVLDELLQNFGAVAQVTRGDRDIGAHRLIDQRVDIVLKIGAEQCLNGRPDAIHDRKQAGRLIRRRLLQLFQSRLHRTALRMPEHDDEAGAKMRRCKLDAADLRGRDDVARDADHKEIAKSLIEDDLRGHPRIRAPEDDRKGLLRGGGFGTPFSTGPGIAFQRSGHEARVPCPEAQEGIVCGNH